MARPLNPVIFSCALFVLLVSACGQQSSVAPPPDTASAQRDSTGRKQAYAHERDSLSRVYKTLAKKFFLFKETADSVYAYHHLDLYGIFGWQSDIVSAGVDTNGRVFLISNLHGAGYEQLNHDRIAISIDSSRLVSSTGRILQQLPDISTGTHVTMLYDSLADQRLMERVCAAPAGTIGVRAYSGKAALPAFTISPKEKRVIGDCLELGRVIRRINELDKLTGKKSIVFKAGEQRH